MTIGYDIEYKGTTTITIEDVDTDLKLHTSIVTLTGSEGVVMGTVSVGGYRSSLSSPSSSIASPVTNGRWVAGRVCTRKIERREPAADGRYNTTTVGDDRY